MDRSVFLRSLPFLHPIPSACKSWPPQQQLDNEKTYSNVSAIPIPFAPESLSIEPTYSVLGRHDVSAGPAFFQCSSNSRSSSSISTTPIITDNNKSDDDKEVNNSIDTTTATTNSNDPAICNIEISYIPWERLISSKKVNLPNKGISPTQKGLMMKSPGLSAITNNTSLSLSFSTPSKMTCSDSNNMLYSSSSSSNNGLVSQPSLYFRFDKSLIFSVDISQIIDITLDEPQEQQQSDNDTNTNTNLPSSLMIRFQECIFRIFFLPPTPSSCESINIQQHQHVQQQQHLLLQKVYMILIRWLNGETSMEYLTSTPTSPKAVEHNTESSGSSHEPGQHYHDDVLHDQVDNYKVTKVSISPSSNKTKVTINMEEEDPCSNNNSKRRKLQSRNRSWEAIQTLFSKSIPTGIASSMPEHDINNLLTISTKSYTQSYFSSSTEEEWKIQEQHLIEQSSYKLNVLEQKMTSIFPTPNKTKLQLKASSQKNNGKQLLSFNGEEKEKEMTFENVEMLLKEYQDMVRFRHELACLPRR